MENDSRTKGIENQNLTRLKEEMTHLLAENNYRIDGKKIEETIGFLVRKIAENGFIRTHALLINWLQELFEFGELKSHTFQELIEKLPWGWDQSKKYLDRLEENNLITYSRDSSGRKTCQLLIPNLREENISNQLYVLMNFFTYISPPTPKTLKRIHYCYKQYCQLKIKLETIEQKVSTGRKHLRLATEKEQKEYIESIVYAYFQPEDFEEITTQKRIEVALKLEPLMMRGIKRED